MKKHFGKIVMLTAAMLVAVPTAVVLSACGSKEEHIADSAWQMDAENHWHRCATDIDDNHQFDLGEHTWKINNEEYTCTVCAYTKTVAGANNQHVRTLQTAWQNLNPYQCGVTYITKSGNSDAHTTSWDLAKGIYYSGDYKIFQDGDRYIENSGDYYRLIDQTYVSKYLSSEYFDLISEYSSEFRPVFDRGTLDSTTFADCLFALFKQMFVVRENVIVTIDNSSYQIDYAIQDELLTVTATVQGVFMEKYDDVTAITPKTAAITFMVDHGVFVGIGMQRCRCTNQYNIETERSIIKYAFDQVGFDKIKTDELPEDIQIKTFPIAVNIRSYFNSNWWGRGFAIDVPYNVTVTEEYMENYTPQVQADAAKRIMFSVGNYSGFAKIQDPTTIPVYWRSGGNSSFALNYNNGYGVYLDACVPIQEIELNFTIPTINGTTLLSGKLMVPFGTTISPENIGDFFNGELQTIFARQCRIADATKIQIDWAFDTFTVDGSVDLQLNAKVSTTNLVPVSLRIYVGNRTDYGSLGVFIDSLNSIITSDNINDCTEQLQAYIAELHGVDVNKVQVIWSNSDYETPFNGILTVGGSSSCLYAKIIIAE